ncbi:hypothetical protein LEP1GSC088_1847 [Leptospira interrogans str. L1207]|nr:hypothetical protein LEP1GSC088_1847 [Leptospira interrogans str. L1207]
MYGSNKVKVVFFQKMELTFYITFWEIRFSIILKILKEISLIILVNSL